MTQTLRSLDYEYRRDVKIPADLWIGLKWKDDSGQDYETRLTPRDQINGKRMAVLRLSSYVGTAALGAMHYYGRIQVNTNAYNVKEGCWSGGYMGKAKPDFASTLTINVERRLTKIEYDDSREPLGKVGDYTYRFNLEKDVMPHAIKTFKRKFGPGWVLVPEDWDGDQRPILCET